MQVLHPPQALIGLQVLQVGTGVQELHVLHGRGVLQEGRGVLQGAGVLQVEQLGRTLTTMIFFLITLTGRAQGFGAQGLVAQELGAQELVAQGVGATGAQQVD